MENMETTIIHNVTIIADRLIPDGILVIRNRQIDFVGSQEEFHQKRAPTGEWAAIDGAGGYAAPGLIDIHIHGANGCDVLDGSQQAIAAISRYCAQGGTTGFLPTTVTAAADKTLRAAQAVRNFAEEYPVHPAGAQVLGIHLEGPYLNVERKGAQYAAAIRPVDLGELEELYLVLGNNWKLSTIAPELPGAESAIAWLTDRGITVAAGHSTATYDQSLQAFAWGVSHITHIFNGMNPMHHREPGLLGASLTEPGIHCQLVADGVHVHPAVAKLLYRMVGPQRIALITDAVQAAGLSDGNYALGDLAISVRQGTAWLPDGTLAGSTLTMLEAVRNVVDWLDISLVDAFRMASLTPAVSIGMEKRGWLRPGYKADLLLLDKALGLEQTIVAGTTVYQKQ